MAVIWCCDDNFLHIYDDGDVGGGRGDGGGGLCYGGDFLSYIFSVSEEYKDYTFDYDDMAV